MDLQDVKNITIPEGGVKTIHDKNNQLLWGAVGYDTKYMGDTTQQTYTGKNLFNFDNGTLNFTQHITHTNDSNSVTMTATDATGTQYAIMRFNDLDPTKTYKISGKAKKLVAGSAGSPFLRIVREYSDNGTTWTGYNYVYNNTDPTAGTEYSFSATITGHQYLRLYFFNSAGTTVTVGESSTYYEVQLEQSDAPSAYEPYVGGIPSPNPDYPQTVNVVTGTQTITISDGTLSEDFTVNLGNTELCKIDIYQDYIYKSGDEWYVKKYVGKLILDGSISWSSTSGGYFFGSDFKNGLPNSSVNIIADKLTSVSRNDINTSLYEICLNSSKSILIGYPSASSASDLKTKLGADNVTVYAPIETPTDTQITDATLINQLNAIHEWLTRFGYSATVTGSLPIIIDQTPLA